MAEVPDIWSKMVEMRGRQKTSLVMIELALALEACRFEEGIYPDGLSQLTPDYIPEVPPDYFTMKPRTYTKTETGYILYSFGPDMDDDGGRSIRTSMTGGYKPGRNQVLFPPDGVIEVDDGDIVIEVK